MASKPFYEEGLHVAKVVSQGIAKASTGTLQFVLRIKILGIVDPTDETNYTPHRTQYERTIYRAITDKTVEYLLGDLEVLGFEGSQPSELDPSHPNHQSFAGKQIDVVCTHEEDTKGGTREKWSIARGLGGRAIEPLQARELRQLDSLFGKAFKGRKKGPAPVLAGGGDADETQLGITDDDIPF